MVNEGDFNLILVTSVCVTLSIDKCEIHEEMLSVTF